MRALAITLCLSGVLALTARAQTNLPTLGDSGGIDHVDLVVTYDTSATPALALVANDDDAGIPYSSNEVVLVATEASRFTLAFDVPDLSLTNGQTFWWLRQVAPPTGTLFPGFATDPGIPAGTFSGAFSVRLTAVEGPGGVFIWQESGGIDLLADSRDGLDSGDFLQILSSPGSHDHFNFGFTTPGVYCVTFRVDGSLTVGGLVSSLETTFVFHVRPLGIVTPYTLWQKAHWLQGTPDTITGPGADPEGDELSNAIEYASNLDPTTMTVSNRPTWSLVADGGQQYGAWTFTRVRAIPDVLYNPAASDSVAGSAWKAMTNEVIVVDENDTERVTLRDNQAVDTSSSRFFRYRVELTP
jgi:surface-anchored protein